MEPYPIQPLLVAGTAGQYAIAWSQQHRDWLVLRHTPQPNGHPYWLWIATADTEEKARSLAVQCYDDEHRWTVA